MLARSVSRVFKAKVPDAPMAGHATLLEALQAGVAGQLASLGDPGLTSTGESSAEVPEVPVTVLAEKLAGHLLREIVFRGAHGGPLEPLAEQLNNDVTHLHLQQLEGMVGRLAEELREALARQNDTHTVAVPPVALAQLPP